MKDQYLVVELRRGKHVFSSLNGSREFPMAMIRGMLNNEYRAIDGVIVYKVADDGSMLMMGRYSKENVK